MSPKNVIPDEDWDRFEEETEGEEDQPFLKIGYFLGRYTNINVKFKQKDDKVVIETSQDVDITTMFDDILDLWKNKKKKKRK